MAMGSVIAAFALLFLKMRPDEPVRKPRLSQMPVPSALCQRFGHLKSRAGHRRLRLNALPGVAAVLIWLYLLLARAASGASAPVVDRRRRRVRSPGRRRHSGPQ